MIKLAVSGACGRMGHVMLNLVRKDFSDQFKLVGALESPSHPCQGREIGECLQMGLWRVRVNATLENIPRGTVLIEFSHPEATLAHLREARKRDFSMVIGTTGFTPFQAKELSKLGKTIPCVWAPNMSLGVAVLAGLVERAASALGAQFDIEIVEAHHRHKKDAPSGTAKQLAEAATKGRKGRLAPPIHSLRAGDIVGDHTVVFAGPAERLEFTHRAQHREAFARGALLAARFVTSAPKGLYGMNDVLGVKG